MKILIKANADPSPKTRTLEIKVDVIACIPSSQTLAASTNPNDIPIANRAIAEHLADDYDDLVDEIISIIEYFGYSELEHHQSDRSNSLYFTFCRKDELVIDEVTLIAHLRVSDHEIPKWRNDVSDQEAKDRMSNAIMKFADENGFINLYPKGAEDVEPAIIIVQYDNKSYYVYDDLFRDIKAKLKKFHDANT